MEPSVDSLVDELSKRIRSYPVDIQAALWRFYITGEAIHYPDGFEEARRSLMAFALHKMLAAQSQHWPEANLPMT